VVSFCLSFLIVALVIAGAAVFITSLLSALGENLSNRPPRTLLAWFRRLPKNKWKLVFPSPCISSVIIVFAACPAENTNRTDVGDRRAVAQPRIRGVGHAGVPPVHLQRGHLGVGRRVLRGDGFPPGAERTIQRGSAGNPTRAHRDWHDRRRVPRVRGGHARGDFPRPENLRGCPGLRLPRLRHYFF